MLEENLFATVEWLESQGIHEWSEWEYPAEDSGNVGYVVYDYYYWLMFYSRSGELVRFSTKPSRAQVRLLQQLLALPEGVDPPK